MLLSSLHQKINYHKNHLRNIVINSKEYQKLTEDYKNALNDKDKEEISNKMKIMNISESDFIKIYMKNFNFFLVKVNDNFQNKFKNNKFISENDRSIFEDYFYFLTNYEFDSKNSLDFRTFFLWNETFYKKTDENKIEIIKKYKGIAGNDFHFFYVLKNDILTIETDKKKENIENIDKYCFSSLLNDIFQDRLDNLDYYKNKNLKPNYYKENLFLMKNKDIWKNLNLKILSSNAVKEAVDTLFNNSYVDILSDKDLLSEILNNIKFYVYKTSSPHLTIENSLNIYELGIYNKEKTMSESLLIFYACSICSNIIQIGVHLNIKIQNFSSMNKGDESIKIIEDGKIDIENRIINEEKLVETIEMALFGKFLDEITLKEALFILESNNYNSLQDFNQNFKKCNTKKLEEIISEETNELYLKPLGINLKELDVNTKKLYKNNHINISRREQKKTYNRGVNSSHPPEFYYEIDRKFVDYVLKNYID